MQIAPPPLPRRPSRHTHQVRIGQRYIIFAILINLLATLLGALSGSESGFTFIRILVLLLAVSALILGISGIFTMGAGLRYNPSTRALLALLMFVPILNLVMLLVLNTKATSMLRAAGYRVGLLGAKSSRA